MKVCHAQARGCDLDGYSSGSRLFQKTTPMAEGRRTQDNYVMSLLSVHVQKGDVVECEIAEIGTIRNEIQ